MRELLTYPQTVWGARRWREITVILRRSNIGGAQGREQNQCLPLCFLCGVAANLVILYFGWVLRSLLARRALVLLTCSNITRPEGTGRTDQS